MSYHRYWISLYKWQWHRAFLFQDALPKNYCVEGINTGGTLLKKATLDETTKIMSLFNIQKDETIKMSDIQSKVHVAVAILLMHELEM